MVEALFLEESSRLNMIFVFALLRGSRAEALNPRPWDVLLIPTVLTRDSSTPY